MIFPLKLHLYIEDVPLPRPLWRPESTPKKNTSRLSGTVSRPDFTSMAKCDLLGKQTWNQSNSANIADIKILTTQVYQSCVHLAGGEYIPQHDN